MKNYLFELLSGTEYAGKIAMFNGSNNDPKSKEIYSAWKEQNKDTDRATGSRSADIRTALVDYFKNEAQIMIATEAAAEGINLQFCSLVVNYDLPDTLENYVHRVGRTGRGSQKGQAVSFCSLEEEELLEIIEKNLGKAIQRMEISKKDYKYTLESSENKSNDWRSLLEEEEEYKRKKKKRKSRS